MIWFYNLFYKTIINCTTYLDNLNDSWIVFGIVVIQYFYTI